MLNVSTLLLSSIFQNSQTHFVVMSFYNRQIEWTRVNKRIWRVPNIKICYVWSQWCLVIALASPYWGENGVLCVTGTLTCPHALQWWRLLVMELNGSWHFMHNVTSFSRIGVGARFPSSVQFWTRQRDSREIRGVPGTVFMIQLFWFKTAGLGQK